MAVLGSGGRLELRREAADPCIILPEDINPGNGSFDMHCEGFWSGDRVVISGPDGLPIFINGVPQRWDGVASYRQNVLFVAANRDDIADEADVFYKRGTEDYFNGVATMQNDDSLFYYQGENANDDQTTDLDGYICVDPLGRLKLYDTRCEGLACCGTGELDFTENGQILDFDFFVLNHYGSSEYQNAVTACFGEIGEYVFNDIAEDASVDPNPTLASICADPPTYIQPIAGTDEYSNADIQPRGQSSTSPHPLWTVLCEIREWSLELDAPSVDTTGVGEKFGEAVKSLVTGGGSADFFIDRTCFDEEYQDNGIYLMQMLLMTQMDGCKAHAKFFMIDQGDTCSSTRCGDLGGSLWYETDILVTRNAVNLRPTDLVAGTANFVTTGEIKLLMGDPNAAPGGSDGNRVDLTITSESFTAGQAIPQAFYYNQGTCPGSNDSPQLTWTTTAQNISSWRLRCVDQSANNFLHWSVNNIPAATTSIATNAAWPAGTVVNNTDWNPNPVRANGWGGPCPPAGTGTHTYQISIEGRNAAGQVITSGLIRFTAAP